MGYSTQQIVRARELREAGWTLRRICELVESETGQRPSQNTICLWTDEGQREKNRERQRVNNARRYPEGRIGSPHHTVAFQENRARLLAQGGMTYINVARVMDFDYPGQRWTYRRVLALLGPARSSVPVGEVRRAA